MKRTPLLLISLLAALACGGFGDPKPEEPPVLPVEATTGPTLWEVTHEEKQDLVKAGEADGLAKDAVVVLLGPALAGTENRQIVGSAKVVEIWPDLARVQVERIKKDAPQPEMARAWSPEDQAALDAIPPMKAGGRAAASGTSAATGGPVPTGTTEAPAAEFTAADLPADLRGGTGDSREEALVRYEDNGSMTQAIVWVMKHDSDDDVRMKAWRVVRARWKRGTGSAAEHEAAAVWLSSNGTQDQRIEAINEIGARSRSLNAAAKHVADPIQPVRVAAAEAVHDVGSRTGKRTEAREILQDRLKVESVSAVRKKLGDWVGDL